MSWENVMQLICAMLTGAATAIPLVIKLVEYVRQAAQERNWKKLLELTVSLMEDAEQLFEDGQARKEYVMGAVDKLAGTIGYAVDSEELGRMIDRLCEMSKSVNAK